MQIHCVMEEDFDSAPRWKITAKKGLGFWPEEAAGEWSSSDYKKTPVLTGEFDELDFAEKTEGGNRYVLVVSAKGERVWFNAGAIKIPQAGRYPLAFDYATQVRKAQHGIRGSATVIYEDQTLEFGLMAVRAKTRREGPRTGATRIGTTSTPYTIVGPGLYRGYVTPRGKYVTAHGDNGLRKSLSIYVHQQWEDDKWVNGVRKKSGRSNNVFIHPAAIPDWLDGCLALGHEFSDFGFVSGPDSTEAHMELFAMLGIKTDAEFTKTQKLADAKKPRALITMTDKRPGAVDVVTLRVHLPIDPADPRATDDSFTLSSSDGSYQKTLGTKHDAIPGDKSLDLVFDGIDRSLVYSLEVDPGKDGTPYFVFESMPYSKIVSDKLAR